MYGYFGQMDMSGLGYGQADDMGTLGNVMEIAQKRVLGVPVWGIALGALGVLAATGKIKIPGMSVAKKRNPRRRRKNRRSRR